MNYVNQSWKMEQVSPETIMMMDFQRGRSEETFGGSLGAVGGAYMDPRAMNISNHRKRSFGAVFFNCSARILTLKQLSVDAGLDAGSPLPANDPANRGNEGDISVNGWNSSGLRGYWTAKNGD